MRDRSPASIHYPPTQMHTTSLTPCIQPNPDISGIGVRASIYAQAFLSLVSLLIFVIDGDITFEEGLSINDIVITNELTASALLLSAIIQARTYGLSTYHANIVLILSWISFVPTIFIGLGIGNARSNAVRPIDPIEGRHKFWSRVGWKGFLGGQLLLMHYIAVAGFGLWVWSDVKAFGNQPQCTPQTFVVIFGYNILVTNPGLKIVALIIYGEIAFASIILIPYAILVQSRHCERLLPRLYNYHRSRMQGLNQDVPQKQKQTYWITFLAVMFGVEILFVSSTEVLIRRSKDLVYPGESQWTFGQSLAMFLVFAPLATTIGELQKGYQELRERRRRKESQDDELPMMNPERLD
jgi:NO-binding membrane sensor protein with MHYT domain